MGHLVPGTDNRGGFYRAGTSYADDSIPTGRQRDSIIWESRVSEAAIEPRYKALHVTGEAGAGRRADKQWVKDLQLAELGREMSDGVSAEDDAGSWTLSRRGGGWDHGKWPWGESCRLGGSNDGGGG